MSAWLWGLMASEGVFRHCTLTLIQKDAIKLVEYFFSSQAGYRGILTDVIVYIFAHLHTALLAVGNMLDIN